MSKKKQQLKASTAAKPEVEDTTLGIKGLVADPKKEGIPVCLQTQNRHLVFPESEKSRAIAQAANVVKLRPFDQPKGESDEEYAARKNRERIAEENKKQREPKAPKPPKAEAPKDSFTLRQLARDNKIDPRQARAVARANADFLKPLWANGMKHTFLNGDKQRVLDVITKGLADKPTKGERKPRKSKATKIPPPPETVFTGKAKVNRQNTAPPADVKGPKAKAREEAAKLIADKKKQDAAAKKQAKDIAKREAAIDKQARKGTPARTPKDHVAAVIAKTKLSNASKKERDGGKPAPRTTSKK